MFTGRSDAPHHDEAHTHAHDNNNSQPVFMNKWISMTFNRFRQSANANLVCDYFEKWKKKTNRKHPLFLTLNSQCIINWIHSLFVLVNSLYKCAPFLFIEWNIDKIYVANGYESQNDVINLMEFSKWCAFNLITIWCYYIRFTLILLTPFFKQSIFSWNIYRAHNCLSFRKPHSSSWSKVVLQ